MMKVSRALALVVITGACIVIAALAIKALAVRFLGGKTEAPTHNYDYRDGMQYGYTKAGTPSDKQNGVAAREVVMLMYAGKDGDVYQLHSWNGNALTAMECALPCEVVKVMSVMDVPGTERAPVSTRRLRLEVNSVARLAFDDAAGGYLAPYAVREKSGSKEQYYQVWVDESTGIVKLPTTPPTN